MNEILKELMERAMPDIDMKARNGVELNNGERLTFMTEWYTNFAKLIINECADIATVNQYQPGPTGEYIKDYFYGTDRKVHRDAI